MEKIKDALVIVDTQCGFMPAHEGIRLGNLHGFGELPVEGGEKIVPRINELTLAIARRGIITTTQDWHPRETAHISENPNYIDTWPEHCIKNTPGARLHPELLVTRGYTPFTSFLKGDKPVPTPAEDDSYTGALSYDPITGVKLPRWLEEQDANNVYVAGLALGDGAEHPLCVDSTARDLKALGFEVTLVTDAAEAVIPENRQKCFNNMARLGIRLMTTEEVLAEVLAEVK